MPDLADLYPGFASKWFDTSAGRIFARTGGAGPPLLLLHAYPQTNVICHPVAPALAPPGRPEQLATLDIVPTWAMWPHMDARLANRAWHWMFLALPAPFPETMIGKDPLYYFDSRAAAGTKIKSLSAFDPRALAHYHAFFNDPVRIHATCEDYRAGRTTDLAHDAADRAVGKRITCPLLAIWRGDGGIPAETPGPLATWQEWTADA